jgi:hypothetical protein
MLNASMAVLTVAGLVLSSLHSSEPTPVALGRDQPVNSAVWLTLAIFLGASGSLAFASRTAFRLSRLAGLLVSLIFAVLSIFSTLWTAQRMHVAQKPDQFGAFFDLIFCGTLVLFLALAGREPLKVFFQTMLANSDAATNRRTDVAVAAAFAIVLIGIWSWLARLGAETASRALL